MKQGYAPLLHYFPDNYRWSAGFINMLSSAPYGGSELNELHRIGTALADRMFHFHVQSAIDAFLAHALAMDLPHRRRRVVLGPARQRVIEGDERAVGHTAGDFQPATAGVGSAPAKPWSGVRLKASFGFPAP